MTELQVGVIVLAAGRSQRMGTTKQLLPLLGKPAILHFLEIFWKAGFSRPIVVLAPDGWKIAGILTGRSVSLAWNKNFRSEMKDSVITGLKASSPNCTAFIVSPADFPLVNSSTIISLVKIHEDKPEKIVIPTHKGKRGHPVLFPRAMLEELDSKSNLRDIIRRYSAEVIHHSVEDEGILQDMDTPSDYESMCLRIISKST